MVMVEPDLERRWNKTQKGKWNRREILKGTAVSETFLHRHWKELTKEERHCCFSMQKLSTSFVKERWYRMSGDNRRTCLVKQQLASLFLDELWDNLTEQLRVITCNHQRLASWFIKKRWHEMTTRNRSDCIDRQREFPASIVVDHWDELNTVERIKCTLHSEYNLSGVSLEELPEYLSHWIEGIRLSAEKRLQDLERSTQKNDCGRETHPNKEISASVGGVQRG